MNVLIDMNLSTQWVPLLVSNGHHAMHWSAIGPPDAGDDALIAYATEHDSVILTNDLDFGITLVTSGRTKPSVLQLRSDDLRPAALGSSVLDVLAAHRTALDDGALVTIDIARQRIRLLSLAADR